MRSPLTALAAAVVVVVATGCGESRPAPPPAPPLTTVPASPGPHVAVIVMENEEFGGVIGSHDAPYINSLARRYALFTRSYGVAHPSLPNYLALIGGDTFGVDSDCTDCDNLAGPTLAGQLDAAGLGWRAYMESMPRPCYRGASAGDYAKKHDPFVYFRSTRCANVIPAGRLVGDLRGGRLPAFAFITPNLCDDMHDCSVATGDRWLRGLVPSLLRGIGPNGFLVLTFDEGDSDKGCCGLAHGGRIATIVAGPTVRPGAQVATPVTHYSTLRTIEDAFGLPPLRHAADPRTQPLDGAFTAPPRLLKSRAP